MIICVGGFNNTGKTAIIDFLSDTEAFFHLLVALGNRLYLGIRLVYITLEISLSRV